MDLDHTSASTILATAPGGVTVRREDYHGWPDCYVLSNAQVEAVVVPAIGRIMQFRLRGDTEGVFWENRRLDGMPPTPMPGEWKNFGGEKTWPAPQADWQRITGRAWPPPAAFDCAACQPSVAGADLILTSPVEPSYGIQTVRSISLERNRPRLIVTTVYRKVIGAPVRVAIWVISQMRDAERVFLLLPQSQPGGGVEAVLGPTPKDLRVEGRLLSLRRDPDHDVKVASPGTSALWVGEHCLARMDLPSPQAGGGRVAIYTNKDPQPYVELETEGPAAEMTAGSTAEQTTAYTLARRSCDDVFAEARQAFGLADAGRTA